MLVFNDLDLLVLLTLMTKELNNNGAEYPLLMTFGGIWQRCLSDYAPGVIDLGLDRAVSGWQEREQLNKILLVVEQKLKGFGDVIDAQVLNSLAHVPGVLFHDYRTALLVSALENLKLLITIT